MSDRIRIVHVVYIPDDKLYEGYRFSRTSVLSRYPCAFGRCHISHHETFSSEFTETKIQSFCTDLLSRHGEQWTTEPISHFLGFLVLELVLVPEATVFTEAPISLAHFCSSRQASLLHSSPIQSLETMTSTDLC